MRRWLPVGAMVTVVAAGLAVAGATAARADTPWREVSVQLHPTQPDDEGRPVVLDAGLDIPTTGCPCPGVLINHGFEGNWHSEDYSARDLAAHGYVVLRYSSRGFGTSGGEVDLVGPKERQDQLDAVHWLNDKHNPLVGGMVVHNDIGQYGASYGGMHAWALAQSGDPAVRTVIPTASWTDGYQALLPNDVLRIAYDAGFYATGFAPTATLVGDAGSPGSVPALSTQLNYSADMHRWFAEAVSGANASDFAAGLAARSVNGHYDRVHIPVFIVQGVNDGLFSANQAIDAYTQLTRRGIPTRLYVGGIGHPPANGSTTSAEALHVGDELLAWFDHYLKHVDNGIDRMPSVEWGRAVYFGNRWDGTTRSSWSYPFGAPLRLNLCGGALGQDACPAATPQVAVNTAAGSGYDEEPITGPSIDSGLRQLTGGAPPNLKAAPGTLSFDTPPLTAPLDLAGVPMIHLQAASADMLPAGIRAAVAAFQLDPKIYDVAPDGTARLLTRGAFAEPLDAASPLSTGRVTPLHNVDIDVFGVSHLVPAGDRLRLTLSTEDTPYLRATVNPFAVAVFAGSTIDLPLGTSMFTTPTTPPPAPTPTPHGQGGGGGPSDPPHSASAHDAAQAGGAGAAKAAPSDAPTSRSAHLTAAAGGAPMDVRAMLAGALLALAVPAVIGRNRRRRVR
jgi:ABC-2 type transport system ATP-binding protein